MKLLPGSITHSWLPASKEELLEERAEQRSSGEAPQGVQSWGGMEEAEEGEEAQQD